MWTLKVVLLLLPAVAYCGVSIRIDPGFTEETTVVSFSGSDESIISDEDRNKFKIDNANLFPLVTEYVGPNFCTYVYVKQPTDYGNVYDEKGWTQVKRVMTPVGYKIIGITKKPDIVVTAEYENTHDSATATYSTSISKTVEEEIGHKWSTKGEWSFEQKISYSIGIGAAKVGGETTTSYKSGWGEEKSKTSKVIIGTTTSVTVPVPPGKKVVARVTAETATLEVEITYEVTLNDADVACYNKKKKADRHFWKYSLRSIQRYGKLPVKFTSTERISVDFYSSAKSTISNE